MELEAEFARLSPDMASLDVPFGFSTDAPKSKYVALAKLMPGGNGWKIWVLDTATLSLDEHRFAPLPRQIPSLIGASQRGNPNAQGLPQVAADGVFDDVAIGGAISGLGNSFMLKYLEVARKVQEHLANLRYTFKRIGSVYYDREDNSADGFASIYNSGRVAQDQTAVNRGSYEICRNSKPHMRMPDQRHGPVLRGRAPARAAARRRRHRRCLAGNTLFLDDDDNAACFTQRGRRDPSIPIPSTMIPSLPIAPSHSNKTIAAKRQYELFAKLSLSAADGDYPSGGRAAAAGRGGRGAPRRARLRLYPLRNQPPR